MIRSRGRQGPPAESIDAVRPPQCSVTSDSRGSSVARARPPFPKDLPMAQAQRSLPKMRQILARLATIISLVELLIMLCLALWPHALNNYQLALLDVSLLVILSTPLVYLWVVAPFVRSRDAAVAALTELALTDPLTSLPNRRMVAQRLRGLIALGARHNRFTAVLVVDLDGFKPINDRYSHEAGDAVLVEVARRLRRTLRTDDVAGRMGGDEFVVLLGCLGGDGRAARRAAERVAEKLIDALADPVVVEAGRLRIGASVGVRLIEPGPLEPDEAMRDADAAMYHAKNAGGGCVCFFSAGVPCGD